MRIRSRWLTKAAVWCILFLMRMLFATCRKRFYETEPGTNAYIDLGDVHHLYSIWHDQIVMVLFSGKPLKSAGLVSKHQDGGYVADVMRMRGIKPVRGSTKRGGAEALRQLLESIRKTHVTITPDGPRGPRREIKPGIVFLASHSGRKIVPTAFCSKRFWSIRGNWTDMMIPRPFTTIAVLSGKPLEVPPDLDREGIQEYVELLEARMRECEDQVRRLLNGEPFEQVVNNDGESVGNRIAA